MNLTPIRERRPSLSGTQKISSVTIFVTHKGRHITLTLKDACIMYNHPSTTSVPPSPTPLIYTHKPTEIQGKNVVPSCYEESRTHTSVAVVM